MADSNVLMPRDYLWRLLAAWRDDTGLVASRPSAAAPAGSGPSSNAFLNNHQARWQLTADRIGLGFAQGKSMLYRRSIIDGAGGIRALATEPAEDAATTKIVRKAGLRVRLVDALFGQPLGERSAQKCGCASYAPPAARIVPGLLRAGTRLRRRLAADRGRLRGGRLAMALAQRRGLCRLCRRRPCSRARPAGTCAGARRWRGCCAISAAGGLDRRLGRHRFRVARTAGGNDRIPPRRLEAHPGPRQSRSPGTVPGASRSDRVV